MPAVVWEFSMPLGYEVFAGNRRDVTTVEEIVETMENRYGKANRPNKISQSLEVRSFTPDQAPNRYR